MKELQFIESILRETAVYAKDKYADRMNLDVSMKGETTNILTEVDLEVQRRIVGRLGKEFPGDLVVAEEAGLDRNPADEDCRCWVMDPIDGTQNFVRGLFPIFGISLAFAVGGRPVAAGIIMPVGDDIFLAEEDAGATRNGRRIHVSDINDISAAKLEVDFVRLSNRHVALKAAEEVFRKVGAVRSKGCAVAALCSIANGDAEAYLHVGLQPWDYAAAQLIVEEAGGKLSRLDGSPLELFDGKKGLLASNGILHAEFLSLIKT
ncbi:MAG: inositol monophosphatase [Planctomycetota bacterium]